MLAEPVTGEIHRFPSSKCEGFVDPGSLLSRDHVRAISVDIHFSGVGLSDPWGSGDVIRFIIPVQLLCFTHPLRLEVWITAVPLAGGLLG